ncbi:MAG: hypothetical protein R2787_18095 [Saprospiraceae bacterium]
MKPIIFCLSLSLLLLSCTEQPASTEQSEPTIEEQSGTRGYYVETRKDWLDSLANVVTNIDYVFYNLEISMSMTDEPAIRSAFQQMDTQNPVPLEWNCPAIGRIFYVSNGETVAIAELYFSEGCTFLRFYEYDILATAVRLNEMGVQFLRNIGVPLPKMTSSSQ